MSDAPNKAKRGRPSRYSPEIADEICARLSNGEPLAVICRDDHMPHPSTVRDWINDGSKQMFSRAIAHAREIGFDVIATDCLSIADNAQNDWMDNNDPDNPGFKFNGEHVQRSKLRIETRLKLLAKWDPKRYGEMMRQEISGPDGGEIPMPSKSDAEMAAFAEKLAKAQSKLK